MKAITSTIAFSFCALLTTSASLSAYAQEENQPPPVLVQIDEAREQAISQLTWVPGTVLSAIDANLANYLKMLYSYYSYCLVVEMKSYNAYILF